MFQVMKSQERNKACPQICVVCGDAATGYHYQTAACNRCKAFFRRTILGMKLFPPCPRNGGCYLKTEDDVIIKQCRACRFSRCVEGGMNPLCIDSAIPPEENPVIQEILKLRKDLHCSLEPSPSKMPVVKLEFAPRTVEMLISRLIDELAFLERAHERLRRSRYSPMPEDCIPLAVLIRGHSKLSIEYGDILSVTCEQPSNPCSEADLLWNCIESNGSKCGRRKMRSCLQDFRKVWPHADLVYAIEYLKTFDVFHRLSDDEKIHLARWVAGICAHLTGSFFSYKNKSSITHNPDGSTVRTTCAMDTPQKIEYHFESIQRIRALEMDEKEYVLLKAIIICDPMMDGLSDCTRKMLDEQRARYAQSLFSYMNARRGIDKAPGQFLEMLNLIDWFRKINERRKEHHLLRTVLGQRPACCPKVSKEKPLLQDEIFL